jgi:hypothetical protein
MPGKLGFAADFSEVGDDRWLEVGDREELRHVDDFTVSLWLYFIQATYSLNCLYYKDGAFGLASFGDIGNRVLATLTDNGGAEVARVTGSQPVPQNVWVHLAVSKSGNVLRLYRNGAPDGACQVTGVVAVGGMTRIGACDGGYPFGGGIDEVGFWNRALSDPEVAALYAGGNGLAYENF